MTNPLEQFYRKEQTYIPIPSNGNFYDDGVIELNDANEVGIRPMTAADEVLFKNPDALLNGSAVKDVIKSCVPAVKDVDKLLTNDVDTLIVAIRHASYGNELDVSVACPECNHEGTFSLSMDMTLESSTKLDESYPVNLSNELTAFIRPYTYKESLIAIRKTFEQNNVIKSVEDPSLSEEQKLKIVGSTIESLSKLNFDLVSHCVLKIYRSGETDEDEINVTDNKYISDFINNINRGDIKKIQDKLEEINNIGIKKEFTAKCEKCEHSWEVPIDFNPATFFTESL